MENLAMAVTKAIILAAGNGSRLRPYTDACPKCLLDVGGRPIIDHQLDGLRRCGIGEVVVVVGYCGDRIREHLGAAARYIANPRFESTNSLYSLWLARGELRSGAVILNSDVLALPQLYDRLLRSPDPNAILVERGSGFAAEDMKVSLDGDRVVDFGKDLPSERAHAHNVGVAKFSQSGAAELIECLDRLVAQGHENDWAPAAYRAFGSQWPLVAIATDGRPWIEIDYVEDLTRARREIQPAIVALGDAVAAT
jgi:choline kinase